MKCVRCGSHNTERMYDHVTDKYVLICNECNFIEELE